MLFIQQLSVFSLLVSSAFAAVIPQEKATKAANLKRVIAERQYKRSSVGKRTIIPAPKVSQAYCAGFRNAVGICVEKCDFSFANAIQNQNGGCQCSPGYKQVGLSCVNICATNYFFDPASNKCGCNTNNFDLLSSGLCVSKCNTSTEDRVGEVCQPKCIGNLVRGNDGQCNTCRDNNTSFLSEVFNAAGFRTSAQCVDRCNRLGYFQNPSGGCYGTLGARCNIDGVTCQDGLRCGILGVCNVI